MVQRDQDKINNVDRARMVCEATFYTCQSVHLNNPFRDKIMVILSLV